MDYLSNPMDNNLHSMPCVQRCSQSLAAFVLLATVHFFCGWPTDNKEEWLSAGNKTSYSRPIESHKQLTKNALLFDHMHLFRPGPSFLALNRRVNSVRRVAPFHLLYCSSNCWPVMRLICRKTCIANCH